MKKALSLLLGLSLCCGLALPAAAAESGTADARLAAVTEKVKSTLSLDTAAYSSFDGELEEGAAVPVWSLRWEGDDGALYISATESGKVLSYSRYNGSAAVPAPGGRLGTHFPALSRSDAWTTAQSFLGQVLAPGVETALLDGNVGTGRLSEDRHNFYGDVLVNGLPSPFGFRASVDVETNAVTSFYLTGTPELYGGGVPSPTPTADGTKAAESLKSTLTLRLEYVLGPDGKTAALIYLPNDSHDYYVDGQTGEKVDLSVLREQVWDRGGNGGPALDSAAGESLSSAEQKGVARMEGVLDQDALTAAAQKFTPLGLANYTLSGLTYRVDGETGAVSAALQYTRQSGDSVSRRTVTLDAKTGALLSVYSSSPRGDLAAASVTDVQAQETANAFLRAVCPAQLAKTALYDTPDAVRAYEDGVTASFRFAQKENGYFFPESSLTVSIDRTDGTVAAYTNSFIDGVTFAPTDGLISADAAQDAWFASYAVVLGYVSVPQAPDLNPRAAVSPDGSSTLNTLRLGWSLSRDGWFTGVDAKTGALLGSADQPAQDLAYSDLDGHWVKAKAEALAAYGVGWLGGKLEPGKALTQRDMVALLVSTSGLTYDPAGDAAAADHLYESAYSLGILTKAERADAAVLTRAETVKLLLDCTGYREVASLSNIFLCSYGDAADIPAPYYGYAALAQGLGIVDGGKTARFDALRPATRAEAISMLFQFMSR